MPYFSAHCISDHRISKPNPNPNSNPNHNSNPNPDNSPDNDCSHLLVRDAVVRNAVCRKGGHPSNVLIFFKPLSLRVVTSKKKRAATIFTADSQSYGSSEEITCPSGRSVLDNSCGKCGGKTCGCTCL